jgi:hypothetical protein
MPIPPQLWKSEDPVSKREMTDKTLAADIVVVHNNSCHSSETSDREISVSNSQGDLSTRKSRERQINLYDADVDGLELLKRQQEEDTAIRRVGFVFLAYNVEYW